MGADIGKFRSLPFFKGEPTVYDYVVMIGTIMMFMMIIMIMMIMIMTTIVMCR